MEWNIYSHRTLHQVSVNSEVILSAGAFNSPKLLMLSGIGDKEYLKSKGISVIVDLPGVGRNLQDQVAVRVMYEATQDLYPAISSNRIAEAGLFLHSENKSDVAPDLQLSFVPMLCLPACDSLSFGFTGIATLSHPQSIGSVSLRSSDPKDAPIIRMNYLQRESDVRLLVTGIKLLRELFYTSAFDKFRGSEVAPLADIKSTPEISSYIRNTCGTMFHPIGTCKMGTDAMAVVDPELRVYGVDGLRVVDASIMPTLTTGNINAPIIMIGEKGADLIRRVK